MKHSMISKLSLWGVSLALTLPAGLGWATNLNDPNLFPDPVVAKGRGLMAEALVAAAREAGIYVHEAPDLVALLMQIDIDQHIPPELYRAMAELLAWIYQVERKGVLP